MHFLDSEFDNQISFTITFYWLISLFFSIESHQKKHIYNNSVIKKTQPPHEQCRCIIIEFSNWKEDSIYLV